MCKNDKVIRGYREPFKKNKYSNLELENTQKANFAQPTLLVPSVKEGKIKQL